MTPSSAFGVTVSDFGPIRCGVRSFPIRHDDPPQVAFAIGRAVGAAVTRNRLRRRLEGDPASRLDVPPGLLLIGARPAAMRTHVRSAASNRSSN